MTTKIQNLDTLEPSFKPGRLQSRSLSSFHIMIFTLATIPTTQPYQMTVYSYHLVHDDVCVFYHLQPFPTRFHFPS